MQKPDGQDLVALDEAYLRPEVLQVMVCWIT
jgi:hypothetical protein